MCCINLLTYLLLYLVTLTYIVVQDVILYVLCEKMQFWKAESPDIVITEDLVLRSPSRCPLKSESETRLKRQVDVVRGHTEKLWPYTAISAAVMVLNGARQGTPSNVINFHTKQSGMLLGLLQSLCKFILLFFRRIFVLYFYCTVYVCFC